MSNLSASFFHLEGHMGSSITAAAVTVTVQTFDTLAFCEPAFSHTAEYSMWTKAEENTQLWISWTLYEHLAMFVENCHNTELFHQKATEYPECL